MEQTTAYGCNMSFVRIRIKRTVFLFTVIYPHPSQSQSWLRPTNTTQPHVYSNIYWHAVITKFAAIGDTKYHNVFLVRALLFQIRMYTCESKYEMERSFYRMSAHRRLRCFSSSVWCYMVLFIQRWQLPRLAVTFDPQRSRSEG